MLKLLSSIDPRCHGSTAAAEMMKKLKFLFPTVIPKDQFDNVDKEIDEFHLEDVTPARETDGKEKQLDKWWAEVFHLGKFPLLSKLINLLVHIQWANDRTVIQVIFFSFCTHLIPKGLLTILLYRTWFPGLLFSLRLKYGINGERNCYPYFKKARSPGKRFLNTIVI